MERTPQDVKREVERHLLEQERVKNSLPAVIVIGPFMVIVEATRQKLLRKLRALANGALDQLSHRLRRQMEDVSLSVINIKLSLYCAGDTVHFILVK